MGEKDERVTVVGLGVVGIPVAVKLAEAGYRVTGLDLDATRAGSVASGTYPLAGDEPGLPELLGRVVAEGRLTATTDPMRAFDDADVVIVCVQTPFDTERLEPQYGALRAACSAISSHLRAGMLVIVESTLAPTTMDTLVKPALERESSLRAGRDFDLVHCPERVMPGRLLHNLTSLARVVGGVTPESAERAKRLYASFVTGELDTASMLAAEVVKTAENAYRDVQIGFANELALLCEELGLDAYAIRDLVNKSPERHVHVPGVGVGGHCIPKDTWLLAYGTKGRRTPEIMVASRRVNDGMPAHFAERVLGAMDALGRSPAGARVVVLGAAYLPNTGDTRLTPSLPFARALAQAGASVTLHDPLVTGSLAEFPVTGAAVTDVVEGADAVVLVTAHDAYRGLDLDVLGKRMRTPLLADGRNAWTRDQATAAGCAYVAVGKGDAPGAEGKP